MMKISGELLDEAGKTIVGYLFMATDEAKRIVVECNGHSVPKTEYAATFFCDGGSGEVVRFVGGG